MFGKVAGRHLMFETVVPAPFAGFEVNDLGYLRRADQQSWNTWMGFFDRKQREFTNRFQWNNNWWQYWTTDGLPLEAAYNTNTHITLQEQHGRALRRHARASSERPTTTAPHAAAPPCGKTATSRRGCSSTATTSGPSFRTSTRTGSSAPAAAAARGTAAPRSTTRCSAVSARRSRSTTRATCRTTSGTATSPTRVKITHYTFAHLNQTTTSATVRLNYTFTPNVSLQAYTQPFVSKGTYSDVRQLSATPRADAYDDRYAAYGDTSVTNNPGGFNFKEFQSNVVFRWEYRPGSTLFARLERGASGFRADAGHARFHGRRAGL